VLSRETGETGVPGIFAAGDVVRGADLVAPVVADAWSVAEAIDAYLRA
jgi:NADPH-dependent glutamate synthase beta subunit-like oxidoreductase